MASKPFDRGDEMVRVYNSHCAVQYGSVCSRIPVQYRAGLVKLLSALQQFHVPKAEEPRSSIQTRQMKMLGLPMLAEEPAMLQPRRCFRVTKRRR